MPRWTPPNPAAVIPRQVAAWCPTFGEPPFRTADLARAGLLHGMAAVRLTPVHHPACGGWHNRTHQEEHMTSNQILAVMALMRDIEAPTKTYNAALRKAWRTATDSPENEAAQAKGNAALLEIEAAVRQWVAKNPAIEPVATPAP